MVFMHGEWEIPCVNRQLFADDVFMVDWDT